MEVAPKLLAAIRCLKMLITVASEYDVRMRIYERKLVLQQKCEIIINQLKLINTISSDEFEHIKMQNVVLLAVDKALRQLRKPNIFLSIGSLEKAITPIGGAIERLNGIILRLTDGQLSFGDIIGSLITGANTNVIESSEFDADPNISENTSRRRSRATIPESNLVHRPSIVRSQRSISLRRMRSDSLAFSEPLQLVQDDDFLNEEDLCIPGSSLFAEIYKNEFSEIRSQVIGTELIQLFIKCREAINAAKVERIVEIGDEYLQSGIYDGVMLCYNFGRCNGNIDAILKLGDLYRNAEDVSIRDPRKALGLFMDAADMKSEEGAEEYIKLCWEFNSTEEEKERARNYLTSKTFENSCIIQYFKGKMLAEGNMVEVHINNAMTTFTKAINIYQSLNKNATVAGQSETLNRYKQAAKLAATEKNSLEKMLMNSRGAQKCGAFTVAAQNHSQQQIKLHYRGISLRSNCCNRSQEWMHEGYKYSNKNTTRELKFPRCMRLVFDFYCSCSERCIFAVEYSMIGSNIRNLGCSRINKCLRVKLSN